MFKSATTKLTILYLAIIMVISMFFSYNLYRLSVDELAWGYQRQNAIIRAVPQFQSIFDGDYLSVGKDEIFNEGKARIALRLVYVNTTILIAGGFLSYWMARKTLQPIEESHDAQSRFAADASHELRTPLTAMQTEIEVALRDPKLTTKDARELLNSNLEELAKLTKLSDGLLRLTQLDSESLPKKPVNVSKIVAIAVERVRSQAKTKKITIDWQAPKSLSLLGDEESIGELVTILLDNAIKYSPTTSDVIIRATNDGQAVTLSVEDHGIGIVAADLPHIYERFYRADGARSKNATSGYGLGLSIAKNIVDLHNGKINVSSAEGKGTKFIVKLPRNLPKTANT